MSMQSATLWTAAHQASLSFTISWSLLKLMSIESWCHPAISSSVIHFFSCSQSFPTSESVPMSWLFTSGGQSIGASTSASVLPVNIQGWFPLGLTGLISLQPLKTLLPTLQFKSVYSSTLNLLYGPTLTFIHGYWEKHSFHYKLWK